jgi:hypothetical protein
MKVNLEKGLSIKIEGELGKYKTLPIEALIKISQSFQQLVQSIARLEIQTEGGIDLDNFKIEIADFKPSSAVPVFVLTPRIKYTIGDDVDNQRKFVSSRVDKIFSIANAGNYLDLKKEYPEAYKRNRIVEDLYNFTTSFGNAPVSFGSLDSKSRFKSSYKLNKFKEPIKKSLITEIKEPLKEETIFITKAVGNVEVKRSDGKMRVTVKEIFEDKHADLSFVTDTIVHDNTVFELSSPLRCKLSKEDDYYIIESELLDIVGTGANEDEAERNFSEEFAYIYKRYNELDDKKLAPRLKRIKSLLGIIIQKVSS